MGRLVRSARAPLAEARMLRLRAARLYFGEGRTQSEVAEALGISRPTAIRLLEEARRRAEVQVWIAPTPGALTGLAAELAARHRLEEVIITPGEGDPAQTATDVGAALGQYLSAAIGDGMTVGVGWGRTLDAARATLRPQKRQDVRVVSLLGGRPAAQAPNPVDFAWQMASALGAECQLLLAPLIVDSAETKRRLIADCGLGQIQASRLDLAVVSCGDLGPEGSAFSRDFLAPDELAALRGLGAVCDTLCQFLDAEGRPVAHPIAERVMAADLETVARAGRAVLASGGRARAPAIRAAIKRLGPAVLVTDEAAARALADLD